MSTLGVAVAGGAGTRLAAGVPKSDVVLGGATLRERAVAALASVCDVVVVAAPESRAPRDTDAESGARWVPDAESGEGPLAGVVAGLCSEPYASAVVLGADFPFVRHEMLQALLDELERSGAACVVPAPGGVLQPLVAVFGPTAAAALATAFERGERSITRAVRSLDPRVLDDAALEALPGGLDNFFNLNTPEDLAIAARRVAEEA